MFSCIAFTIDIQGMGIDKFCKTIDFSNIRVFQVSVIPLIDTSDIGIPLGHQEIPSETFLLDIESVVPGIL